MAARTPAARSMKRFIFGLLEAGSNSTNLLFYTELIRLARRPFPHASASRHAVFEISAREAADLPPPGPARNRLRRPLECRQVHLPSILWSDTTGWPSCPRRRAAPSSSISFGSGTVAAFWLICPVTAMPRCRTRCAGQWQGLLEHYLTRRPRADRPGDDHGFTPSAHAAGPPDDQLVRADRQADPLPADQGGQAESQEQTQILREVQARGWRIPARR